MDVVVVGAHGQIARLLTRRLVRQGDTVRGVIRNPDHADDVQEDGAQPVLLDLEAPGAESDLVRAAEGADAIVFAAGAGPGSSAERKTTVDHRGAVISVQAAERAECKRFVLVSSMGTDDPPQDDEIFSVYLRAKADAERDVRAADIPATIVRPGLLTDQAATGEVRAGRTVERGEIPRADVAGVIDAVLRDESAAGRTFEVVSGPVPIVSAVAGLADQPGTRY